MNKYKVFCGQRYYFMNLTELNGKFVIVAESEFGGVNRAFLDDEGKAIFQSREDAKEWWNNKSTKYKGTEVCAW